MIELIKFILESWQNVTVFILMTTFITFCLSTVVASFKPISYKTIINQKVEEKINE